jgi:hypothetical protein
MSGRGICPGLPGLLLRTLFDPALTVRPEKAPQINTFHPREGRARAAVAALALDSRLRGNDDLKVLIASPQPSFQTGLKSLDSFSVSL